MKKHRLVLYTVFILFLWVNTSYFWEGWLGMLALPAFFLMVLVFLILSMAVLFQFVEIIREKFSDKSKLKKTCFSGISLLLIFLFPAGIIPFEKLEDKPLLVANRKGVANCMSTLKLKKNKTYLFKEICFGVDEQTGKYEVKGDTVFFNSYNRISKYSYAVIKGDTILLCVPEKDEAQLSMIVRENNLVKG